MINADVPITIRHLAGSIPSGGGCDLAAFVLRDAFPGVLAVVIEHISIDGGKAFLVLPAPFWRRSRIVTIGLPADFCEYIYLFDWAEQPVEPATFTVRVPPEALGRKSLLRRLFSPDAGEFAEAVASILFAPAVLASWVLKRAEASAGRGFRVPFTARYCGRREYAVRLAAEIVVLVAAVLSLACATWFQAQPFSLRGAIVTAVAYISAASIGALRRPAGITAGRT